MYRLPTTQEPLGIQRLTEYRVTPLSTKYFCPDCGSHIFGKTGQKWGVSPGVVDGEELQPSVEIVGHEFVEDTGDGGFTSWLTHWGGKVLPRWKGEAHESELLPPEWQSADDNQRNQDTEDDKLWAGCHCGGVAFYITRPNEASRQPRRAPFPELMVPGDKAENPEGQTWWLQAGGTKYLAGLCTCRSCCKATGFDIQAWAFVPECNVFQPNGEPLDVNAGTLKKRYSEKIDGAYRCFCGTCGATVFWGSDNRDGVVDISVGLFKGKGARVEDWLVFGKRVSYVQEATNKKLVQELGRHFTITGWPKA